MVSLELASIEVTGYHIAIISRYSALCFGFCDSSRKIRKAFHKVGLRWRAYLAAIVALLKQLAPRNRGQDGGTSGLPFFYILRVGSSLEGFDPCNLSRDVW